MVIKELQLKNFRNYSECSIELSEGLNLFTGRNAQGKTNLLESIVVLSSTRSHRIKEDQKMIRNSCEFSILSCIYESEGVKKSLKVILHSNGKTLMKNGYTVMKASDFVGEIQTVLFTPDDLRLFTDPPRERRKLINQQLTAVSKSYMASLGRYQSLLKERNSMLKNEKIDESLLNILDDIMSEAEASIYSARKEFIDFINTWIGKIYEKLSDEKADLKIRYVSCCDSDDPAVLKSKRKSLLRKDIEFHVTTTGIHKDDIFFEKDGINMIDTASQGQKRMVILSFRLALLLYIREKTGHKPILLLDDVLSELDYERQIRLLSMVADRYQCIITAAQLPPFIRNLKYRQFYIENGMVKQIQEGENERRKETGSHQK